jgi:hypothetical protein
MPISTLPFGALTLTTCIADLGLIANLRFYIRPGVTIPANGYIKVTFPLEFTTTTTILSINKQNIFFFLLKFFIYFVKNQN